MQYCAQGSLKLEHGHVHVILDANNDPELVIERVKVNVYSETCLFWLSLGQNFLTLLNSGYITQVTLYVNDTFGDYFNGQFRQVTTLYSDLIRQVSLYNHYQNHHFRWLQKVNARITTAWL